MRPSPAWNDLFDRAVRGVRSWRFVLGSCRARLLLKGSSMTLAPRITPAAGTLSAPTTRDAIALALDEARARTLLLIRTVSEADLLKQHDPLMGPILWDLGHIAHFEELWLLRNLDGKVEFVEMPGMYDPFEYPRKARGSLPLPSIAETLRTMAEVRGRVLE